MIIGDPFIFSPATGMIAVLHGNMNVLFYKIAVVDITILTVCGQSFVIVYT